MGVRGEIVETKARESYAAPCALNVNNCVTGRYRMNAIRWTCCAALLCAVFVLGAVTVAAAVVLALLTMLTDALETAARRVRPISRDVRA